MHFIPEACYRRPLEPRSLVYSRATTAIVMGMAFLAFVGYLASQVYYDKPLIYLSTETVPYDTQPADIEFCVQNSTMTIVGCAAVYFNWTSVPIPDCYNRFFRTGAYSETMPCYVFETNGTYRMAIGSPDDGNDYTDSVRRFDFYWRIDNHFNYTSASISVPAIALQLYDPSFSHWKTKTLLNTPVEKQMLNDIQLGYQHVSAIMNASSSLYYTPQKYREIKPRSARALLGLEPDYLDIITLDAKQMDVPLTPDIAPGKAVNRSDYDGLLSIQLSKATIDVKTESRQHTVLAAVALAGGCYGVLTTIYILLFGMTRLTPWGLVHHIPVFISNRRHHKRDDKAFMDAMVLDSSHEKNKNNDIESNDNALMDEFNNESAQKKKKGNLSTKLIPWFFRSNLNAKAVTTDRNTSILERMMSLKKASDQNSRTELGRRESYHIDNDSRTQLPHASETPETNHTQEDLNELSTTSDFLLNNEAQNRQSTSSMKKTPALPRVVTSPTALFFNINNGSNRPPFSPTITKRPSISSDIMLYDQQDQSLQNLSQDSVTILTEVVKQEKEKNKELATRVDELEIILSQYFINTAYLDQLRTKREQSFVDGMSNNAVKRRVTRPSNNGQ